MAGHHRSSVVVLHSLQRATTRVMSHSAHSQAVVRRHGLLHLTVLLLLILVVPSVLLQHVCSYVTPEQLLVTLVRTAKTT